MPTDPQLLAQLAGLLADRTRAAFLLALLDGRAWTMTELAQAAGVGAPTASEQLSRLVAGGLLVEERQGRHRYLRLADQQVAQLVEDLIGHATERPAGSGVSGSTPGAGSGSGLGTTGAVGLRAVKAGAALAAGRTCYDHLAGRLGVVITDALVTRRFVEVADGVRLTEAGASWLTELGVDVPALRSARRPLIRTCLDWTERRSHLAGGVGAALRLSFLAHGWIEPGNLPRAITLTDSGRHELPAVLGLPQLDLLPAAPATSLSRRLGRRPSRRPGSVPGTSVSGASPARGGSGGCRPSGPGPPAEPGRARPGSGGR
jgi:DNA-binding transcriptional ArsR family regulator